MNDLMEELVFDLQLFAAGEPGFDPWGEFNADDESGADDDDDDDDDVVPVDPTSEDTIEPISEDDINTDALNEDGTINEDAIEEGDVVTTTEATETATEVLGAVDTTDATATILYTTTSAETSSGTSYTQITGVAGVRIKASSSGSGSNATLGSGSKKTRISLNAASNVDVMFEYDDSTSSYSTDPTQIRAKDGSGLVIGGAAGVGMAVSGGQVNIDISSGKPSLFQILANAVFSFFSKVSAASSGDVLYDANYEYDETSGVTITFEGFDDEDNNYVTPDGKKIGTIDIANTEDATVTVDGSYAYTFAMHDSSGTSISSDDFELKYVDDGAYVFTVLEDSGIKLDISDITVKDGKTLNVVAAGGADQIVPPTDADGGQITILGTTYKYTAVADSESYFALTDDAVTAFVLGTAGDTIVLDDSSSIAVYDIDDLETNLLDDITFSGGELALTKDSSTTTGYSIDYYFTAAGDTITLTEDTADGFEMFYQSKKVPYDVGEPVISNGGYTVTMTGKDEFTISGLEADASITTADGVTVEFENAGGSVILAATTNSTNLTAALTIAGVTTDGAVTFEDAGDLFAAGVTINGNAVQIDDVDGDLTYNADGTIVVDDTVYAIGDGTYYGYTIAGDADGTVKLTLDDDNVVTAITDLNSGTAEGDFTSVTVNGVTIQTDDTSLVVTGTSDATGIDAISGLDTGKNVTLNGGGTLNINGVDFGYVGEEETVVITGAEEGIASVTGIVSGDAVTIGDTDAIVVLPTDGDEAEVTVNGVKYTFTGDASNVSIDGAGNVGGLDEDAQLVVEGKTGTIYVNGSSGLDVTKTIVGTYDGTQARVVDSSNPIINKNTSVSEVEDMLGLSYSGTQVVAQTSASDLDYTDAGEKKKVTLGQGDQDVTFGEYGKNEVVVADDSTGDKTITLGTRGDAVIVQGSDTDSTINVIGGAGADSVVVQDRAPVEFDMSKGGADKLITFAASNAKVTLDNYDINSGGGLVVHEAAASDIADAIDDGLIQFSGNKLVEVYRDGSRAADITVNNKSGNPATMINLFNTSGDSQKVGFTGSTGGTLDASGVSGDLILIGNKDGNKTGGSTLTAGSGDDTIYAGDGDRVDAGSGINTVNLGGAGGATVVATEGYTTINNLVSGKLGDVLAIDSADDVTFDGSNLIISGSNYAVSASVATDLTGEDYVNQIFEISGQTVEAAIAAAGKDITVSDDYDVPSYFMGNGGVDFSDYTGEVVIDAKGGWKTTEIGGKEVMFSNTITSVRGGAGTTQLKGYEANDIFAAGSGVTSLYGGAGNNTLIGYSGSDKKGATEFFVIGNEDGAKHTIQNFQFGTDFINTDYASNDITKVTVDGSGSNVLLTVTNRNTGAAETATIEGAVNAGNIKIGGLSEGTVAVGQVGSAAVTVDGEANYLAATVAGGATVNVSSALTDKTAIWLDNRGDKWFSDNFAVIDASSSSAELTLAGDAKANTIYGGAGVNSLWGGSGSANDLLVGGTGRNTFYYEQGNGSDTISNANDGDVINLFDTSLENITNANITSGGVVVNFNNGGSIQVNSNAAVEYHLADGSAYTADHNTGSWVKKS